jgi:hypothetical protein
MRRPALIALVFPALVACGGKETNFSNTDDGTNVGTGTTELIFTPDPIVIEIPDTDDQPFTPGVSFSEPFEVTNSGDAELILYNLDLADSADGVVDMQEVENKTVPVGGSREYVVVATLQDRTQVEGLLRVKANAEGWQDARVRVIACVEGACDLSEGDDGAGTGDDGGTGGDDGGTGGDDGGGTGGDDGGGTGGDDGGTGGADSGGGSDGGS